MHTYEGPWKIVKQLRNLFVFKYPEKNRSVSIRHLKPALLQFDSLDSLQRPKKTYAMRSSDGY